jgi:uncharacterized membrane protein YcaP (DUF421 family)
LDFFYGQETLTSIQWISRAIVSFLFLLIATKIMGARSISQLRLIDFTIALILGNIIAHPLSDQKLGMKGSLITTTVLIILYIIFIFSSLKWNTFRKWFEPSPYPLIKNGEIIYANLAKARITIDHLLSELRKDKIEDVQNVALAQWEPDGTISFFLSPQLQAITPEDMQLIKKPFSFQSIIIKEGKIDFQELRRLGKDNLWLENKISILNVEIHDILLATLDDSDDMKIYLYD